MRLNRQVCLNCLFPILSHFRAFLSATFPFFSYNRQDPDSIHSSFHSQPLILTVSLRPGSLIGGHRESVDSGNSSTSEDDFPGLQTNVIPASGSEGLSLASSQGTIRRGRGGPTAHRPPRRRRRRRRLARTRVQLRDDAVPEELRDQRRTGAGGAQIQKPS